MKKKILINNNGYIEGEVEHSGLISRKIAYNSIYLKNRDKYPLYFKKYVIHHIDSDKLNNSIKNLYICTQEQHEKIHDEQKRRMKRFTNSSEIDNFLRSYIPAGQRTLRENEENSPTQIFYEPKRPAFKPLMEEMGYEGTYPPYEPKETPFLLNGLVFHALGILILFAIGVFFFKDLSFTGIFGGLLVSFIFYGILFFWWLEPIREHFE